MDKKYYITKDGLLYKYDGDVLFATYIDEANKNNLNWYQVPGAFNPFNYETNLKRLSEAEVFELFL